MKYWLLKSEPSAYSFADLAASPKQTTFWDGVRNFQARNILRDEMKKGDLCFFYHSSATPMAIMGVVEVVREGYPDHTQFDEKHDHFDAKAKKAEPTWYMVDVKLRQSFSEPIRLEELKKNSALSRMILLQRGSRLSVQPVTPAEFHAIMKMRNAD